MKIFIRNMVCLRCKMVVKSELEKMGVHCTMLELGEVETIETLSALQLNNFNAALQRSGLELIDDQKSLLVEKIKRVIIEIVHYKEDQIKVNLSDYLSEKLRYDYTYMANLFSEVKGMTIEHFFILHRIERVKELLVYNELNLNQIAEKLHYSSSAHLCKQFKKVAGLTPSHFRSLKNERRGTIDNV